MIPRISREHRHELQWAIGSGLICFPVGYLAAALVTADWGWTAGLAEILTAMAFGVLGIIFGSLRGWDKDRKVENTARDVLEKRSARGRMIKGVSDRKPRGARNRDW